MLPQKAVRRLAAYKKTDTARQAGSMEDSHERRETHQGQATGVTADAEKQDAQAGEPPKPQKSDTGESAKGPEGGYDDTPIARREVLPRPRSLGGTGR